MAVVAELGDLVREQLEGGVSYPTSPVGAINAYGGSSRDLAREIDRAEGRADRAPQSTQRSIQRYLKGDRSPRSDRTGLLRRIARGRIAGRRLAPYRARGAKVLFHGRVIVYKGRKGPSYRNVRFEREVSPERFTRALDAAERAMRTGRGWDRTGNEVIRAAFGAYGSPLEEVDTIDALSIRPL